jgi:hypothetical protein
MKKQKKQFDCILCKEDRKDGSYKLHPCYAPSSLSIKRGDIVKVALPELTLLCAYDDEHGRDYVLESAHEGTEIKSGLKVIKWGGTITVNEGDEVPILESFGRILDKGETK